MKAKKKKKGMSLMDIKKFNVIDMHHLYRLAFHDFIFQLFPLFPVRTCGCMHTSCMSAKVTREVRDELVFSDIM